MILLKSDFIRRFPISQAFGGHMRVKRGMKEAAEKALNTDVSLLTNKNEIIFKN